MPRRLLAALALTLGLALVAAACSGSDGDASGDQTDDTSADEINPDGAAAQAAGTTWAAPDGEVADTPPVPSAGCGTSAVGSVVDEQHYLDDSDRWYLLSTPLAHDGETPLPMVIDYHGLSEGAEIHSKMSELGPYADGEGFVVVQPNGTGDPVRWRATLGVDPGDDFEFTETMLDQLGAELCVDTSRIYATGLSNGAFMTSAVACVQSDRFAAVAPVAGVVITDQCDPERPVPLLAFHGTADGILLFNGGIGDSLGTILDGGVENADVGDAATPEADLRGEGYPAAAQGWAELNGCSGDGDDKPATDTVIRRVWDCPAEGATEFWIVDGGGHSWPGSDFNANLERITGTTDLSIEANEVMWAFFQRFALPPV